MGTGGYGGLGLIFLVVACSTDTREGAPADAGATGGRTFGAGGHAPGGTGNSGGGAGGFGGDGGSSGRGNGGSTGGTTPRDAQADAPDGNDCHTCSNALTPERSFECYCAVHSCAPSLRAALQDPGWQRVQKGCGLTVVWSLFGAGSGEWRVFDSATGKPVGGGNNSDVSGPECQKPFNDGEDNAYGGVDFDVFEGLAKTCSSVQTCSLHSFIDAGTSTHVEAGTEAGTDAPRDGGTDSRTDAEAQPSDSGATAVPRCAFVLGDAGGP